MKKTIRIGVWETNSSSVHAVAIPKTNISIDEITSYHNTIHFNHGEFGWEHAVYGDINSRASYLYQAIFDCECPWISPEIRQKNRKEEMSEEDFKKYKKQVKEFHEKRKKFTKAINWIFETLVKYGFNPEFDTDDYDGDGWQKGYIDHGGDTANFIAYILYNEKHLMNYLFGNTQICTTNDSSDMEDYEEFIQDHPQKDYEIFVKGN